MGLSDVVQRRVFRLNFPFGQHTRTIVRPVCPVTRIDPGAQTYFAALLIRRFHLTFEVAVGVGMMFHMVACAHGFGTGH